MSGSESETRTNTPRSPGSRSARRARRRLVDLAVGGGDRVAVRVVGRVAELGGDQLRERGRDRVLEHLGLLVHAVPGHSERLGQVELEQAVVAQHLERDPLARRGQLHAVVGLALDQPHRLEPLDHRRGRRRRHLQPLRERRGRDGLVAALPPATRSPWRSPARRSDDVGRRTAIRRSPAGRSAYITTRPVSRPPVASGLSSRPSAVADARARSGRSPGRSPRRRCRT